MNSLAALSRALSTRSSGSRPASPSRQPSSVRTAPLTPDLAAYELPASSEEVPLDAIKSPETQMLEETEEFLMKQQSGEVASSPTLAYPSPPPTPEPALQLDLQPNAVPPTLTRKLSRKQTAAVERAARALPVRLAVQVYKLIRRMLALMGIRIAELPSLEPPVEIRLTSPPDPSAIQDQPPSYEDAVHRAKPPAAAMPRWPVLPFRKKRDLPTSLAASRRESEQSEKAPSQALAVLNRKKTLVLDLDETLIHSTSRIGGLPSTGGRWGGSGLKVRVVEVVLEGRSVVYHVYKRPWVDLFLRKVAMWYSVVIFTASVQEYADPVIDWLDEGTGIIEARHFRESCIYSNGSYIKDLSLLGPNIDLSRICLIDNSPASFAKNQANGIPIEGFISDPNDQALLELLPILDSLRFTQDVRRVLGLRAWTPHKA